jgi:phenylpyruvate tautomerase PptA (4-oxalocrotonate tautomerase family)
MEVHDMPMIELTTTPGALDEEAKRRLAGELSTITLELEAAGIDFGDDEHVQAVAWCFVNEQQVFAGGRTIGKPIYRVTVTLPEGATGLLGPLASPGRKRLVDRVTAAVLAAEGSENTMVEAHRVWVHLRWIADGHWGAFGERFNVVDVAKYTMKTDKPGSMTDRMREAAMQSVGAVSAP